MLSEVDAQTTDLAGSCSAGSLSDMVSSCKIVFLDFY